MEMEAPPFWSIPLQNGKTYKLQDTVVCTLNMADNLQNRIYSESSYKSGGERKIAQFLEKMNISFSYERPMLIVDKQDKQRIYYPDFWLNDYHIAIEYFGLTGSDKNYDKITQNKQEVYNSMQIDLIPLFPDNLYGTGKKK